MRKLLLTSLSILLFGPLSDVGAIGDAADAVVKATQPVAINAPKNVSVGAQSSAAKKPTAAAQQKAAKKITVRQKDTTSNWDSETSVGEEALQADMPDFGLDESESKTKQADVVKLVKKAIDFCKKNPADKAFSIFTHTKQFVQGELYIFVYDFNGTVLAHGEESSLIWSNMLETKDSFGVQFVQDMINKAKTGGGWTTYEWHNATKISYSENVTKNGKDYVIGCGFYPHSKSDAVVSLVKGAVAHFNEVVKAGGSIEEAFSIFSYPLGKFLMGDLYLYALDSKGVLMAQGDRPGLIGQNVWDYRDSNGQPANQVIIKGLQATSHIGIWIEYDSKKTRKLAYAEKVKDAKGQDFFIVAGYYPEAGRDAAVDLVRRGYQYMKSHGITEAVDAFSTKRHEDFIFGDLSLFVYNMKGVSIADGGNEENVGNNRLEEKDSDGRYFVKEFIEKANSGGGWVDIKVNNLFQSIYVEKVDIGLENFVIGCGVYPISKKEQALLLVKTALSYLRDNESEIAFREFTQPGSYMRGDLSVFVYDAKGLCYANGDDFASIWQNKFTLKDDDGRAYVKMFIDSAKKGGDWITYKINGALKSAYVESLEKDGLSYQIGCAYFQ